MTLYVVTHPDGRPVTDRTSIAATDPYPLPRKDGTGRTPGEWTSPRRSWPKKRTKCLYPVKSLSSVDPALLVGHLWEAEGHGGAIRNRLMPVDDLAIWCSSARLLRLIGEVTHQSLVTAACEWAWHIQPGPPPLESAEAIGAAATWADFPSARNAALAILATTAAARYAFSAACAAAEDGTNRTADGVAVNVRLAANAAANAARSVGDLRHIADTASEACRSVALPARESVFAAAEFGNGYGESADVLAARADDYAAERERYCGFYTERSRRRALKRDRSNYISDYRRSMASDLRSAFHSTWGVEAAWQGDRLIEIVSTR
ncbi:MAG: hypothetical protein ACYCST_11245 [Acidimicrobiales bacterium]